MAVKWPTSNVVSIFADKTILPCLPTTAQNPLIKDSNAGAVMAWMGVDTLTYIIATVVVSADSAQGKMTKFRFPALSSLTAKSPHTIISLATYLP